MRKRSGSFKTRVIIGLAMVAVAYFSYLGKGQDNLLTGESQRVAMSPQQEVTMGLQSAPQMAREYGGLYPDKEVQSQVKTIGNRLVKALNHELQAEGIQNPYRFDFHVLRDNKMVNAFALPGGQIFITAALFGKLKSEDQLAGILGHEIGHVIHRHSSQQMTTTELYQGLAGAATAVSRKVGGTEITSYVAQIKLMKFGRDDELESDDFSVKYMINSGYNPYALIEVMEILAEASSGDMNRDAFMSTHPSPVNRIAKIKAFITKYGG
jgi:predicted Zn-dependent protease